MRTETTKRILDNTPDEVKETNDYLTKTRTRGDVIVEEIKTGDVHYEYEYNFCIKCEVISLPINDGEGYWTWQAKNTKTGAIIDYGMDAKYSHYSPKLYTYEAYSGCKFI